VSPIVHEPAVLFYVPSSFVRRRPPASATLFPYPTLFRSSRGIMMSARSTVMSAEASVGGSDSDELFQSKISGASILPAVTISMSSSGSSSMFVTVSSGAAARSGGSDGAGRPAMPGASPQRRQRRHEEAADAGGEPADGDAPARLSRAGPGLRLEAFEVLEDRGAAPAQLAAHRRQRDPAAGALGLRRSELARELLQLVAH